MFGVLHVGRARHVHVARARVSARAELTQLSSMEGHRGPSWHGPQSGCFGLPFAMLNRAAADHVLMERWSAGKRGPAWPWCKSAVGP